MKKILFILLIVISLFFFISCTESNENKIKSISIDGTLVSGGVKKSDFKFDLIKIIVISSDDNKKEVALTPDLIDNYGDELLEIGTHNIVIKYETFRSTFSYTIKSDEEEKVDVLYIVTYIGMNDEELEKVIVKENDYVLEPISAPLVEGYEFKNWDKSFPFLVNSDVVIKAIYEKIDNFEKVINYLDNYFSYFQKVNQDVVFPSSYDGKSISYKSDNEDRLSSEGKYTKDYKDVVIKITATITDGVKTVKKDYYFKALGYKDLSKPIASTYLYRNYDKLTDEFFETMDIIYCAFVGIDESGNYKTGSALTNMSKYVVKQAHEKGIYVIPSIGGGDSAAAKIFSTIASSETTRKNFAKSMVNLINTYGFDGVDIDWEMPQTSEKENFTLMMKELNSAVKANNKNHLVTAAIGGGMWQPPRYDLPNSRVYMDYINVMLYSMCSTSGQYQNALYASKTKNDATNGCGYTLVSCSFEESVKIYNDYGVDNNKLILGLAFYAVKQVKTDGVFKSGGSVFYTNLKANYLSNSSYKYVYDEVAQVPYLISTDGNTFISFDDPRSVKAKADYVIKTGCAGLMTWENGCDLTGDLVHAMKEGLGK